MKVNRNLNDIFFFCHQKTKKTKNRQALHEIIRPSSVFRIFIELSFKPVCPIMFVKNFKFMENYNSWKMYLQVKKLIVDIFTQMLSLHSLHFLYPPCSLRRPWFGILDYFIWFVIFSKVMALQFCKFIAFCHVAW